MWATLRSCQVMTCLPLIALLVVHPVRQDLSVAGLRKGLAGERSGLFMEQIRIVKEMRERDRQNGRAVELLRPRYMVWENVPGAFSSNEGKDFQAVLTEIIRIADSDAPDVPLPEKGRWTKAGCLYDELGKWSVAWRLHDASFYGVPQRRKRISLLADFSGLSAPEIMFDPEYRAATEDGKPVETLTDLGAGPGCTVRTVRKGLHGDPQPGGAPRKKTAGTAGDGVAATITASYGTKWNGNAGAYNGENFVYDRSIIGVTNRGYASGDVAETLRSDPHGAYPMISQRAISFQERAGKPGGGKGILIQDEHTGALSTVQNQSVYCLQGGGATSQNSQGDGVNEDVSFTLNALDRHGVAYSISHDIRSSKLTDDEITDPLTGTDYKDPPVVAYGLNRERCGAVVAEDVMPTLQAAAGESGNNKPMVMCAGFKPMQGSKALGMGYEEEKAPTLSTNANAGVLCLNDQGGSVMNHSVDVTGALRAEEHGHQPIVYNGSQITSKINHSNPQPGDACHSLTTDDRNYVVVDKKQTVYDWHRQDTRMTELGDVCTTAAAGWGGGGNNMPYVLEEPMLLGNNQNHATVPEDGTSAAFPARMGTCGNQVNAICMDVGFFQTTEEKVGALLARQYKDPPITYQEKTGSLLASGYEKNGTQEAANDMYITGNVVRRLTPLECERLQGYPDGWTDIGDWIDTNGKKHKASDSPRYKALGNSIALPFWFWLLRRISAQYERPATLGSLFDGIGGFPLCWERCNGKGTALWASEIEEFPIAVTKLRFPEKDHMDHDFSRYMNPPEEKK